MRTSRTIGFAVDESDRPRLDHLTDVFGGGNRSAFLRRALDVMERYESAIRLAQVQAYGSTRLAAAELQEQDLPRLVEAALADPDPEAIAQAKLLVASLRGERAELVRTGEPHPTAEAFAALLDDA